MALAALLAGCGSAATPTITTAGVASTPASTSTGPPLSTFTASTATTATRPATSKSADAVEHRPPDRRARVYPASFGRLFTIKCEAYSDVSTCDCVLRRIEASVPYATVRAQYEEVEAGDPPNWFSHAAAACGLE